MGKEEENLVVEVVAAHNLMPKDGQGSSSPFVEVEFEQQKRRTQAVAKDLNPVWNERLLFAAGDPGDFPYRWIDVGVYNERAGSLAGGGRNFLGKVRIPAASVPAVGEEAVPQLFTLEKRSLFSHIRGEISLKIYRIAAAADLKLAKANHLEKPVKAQVKQQQQPAQVPVQPPVQHKPADPPVQHRPPVVPAAAYGGGGRDFELRETRPQLGGGAASRDKTSSTYDLVEQMQYLYVRVVRGRDLGGGGEWHAEVKLGNYRGVTGSSAAAQWDQVFAFSRETIQSSVVEVFVKEKGKDEFIGRTPFDLGEVPRRVPPDSTLAPQWYRMEDKKGEKGKGEVMVSVWFGTQADEAFSESWHSKAAGVHADGLVSLKSKVYVAPKLWYLRVSVLEAQDLVPGDKSAALAPYPEILAKAHVANQTVATRPAPVSANRSSCNPVWNEDLMFVVAEPFEDILVLAVEDRIANELLGRVMFPVSAIERRFGDRQVASRWFGLDRGGPAVGSFGSRVHLRLSLDGGYHVLDESTMYSSDLRPSEKRLWGAHVGVLELGVIGATGLMPMKIRGGKGGATTDAYCVAKYGQKWVRTRTVMDSVSPRWNEQYTWEVFDPCTVITIGVFDNCHVDGGLAVRDSRIGKIRIRLSTLQTERVYTHAYPLLVLHPSGMKKMGELHLAVRFSCINSGNMLQTYVRPLLPKMHYVDPLLVRQVDTLRYQATNVVATRLGRSEPPLGREVVEYMVDHTSHLWSMRRSKANFFRLVAVLSTPIAIHRSIDSLRSWHSPSRSIASLAAFLLFLALPELILPVFFLALALMGLWRYRSRPRHPPHMDARLSHAEPAYADELDEELDTFPTSRGPDVVRARYDRLRSVAGRVQTVVGDFATQGERAGALLSWRDPRATVLFLAACMVGAVVCYAVPVRALLGLWGVYAMRPPRFRSRMPSPVMCFFRRLPTKADGLL